MPWFLVDDQYPMDDRVLATSLAARGLWVTAGAWAGGHRTDVVPDHVLASFGSTPELVSELVTARVLVKARGGYRITQPGLCKIPSQETVDKQRKQKTERQRRWREGQRRRDVDASTEPSTWGPSPSPYPTAGVTTDGARASPRPVDKPGLSQMTNGRPPPRGPQDTPVAEAIAKAIRPDARGDEP